MFSRVFNATIGFVDSEVKSVIKLEGISSFCCRFSPRRTAVIVVEKSRMADQAFVQPIIEVIADNDNYRVPSTRRAAYWHTCWHPFWFKRDPFLRLGLQCNLPTACGHRIAHRKWKEIKLQPGTAGLGNMLGCWLTSFHFLWAILCPQAV